MSELLRRITSADPDEVMPPAESKRTLTETHKSLIRQWISEGAKWEGHWSFQKPTRPALPTISKEDWPANEVDHFILARLEENKLSPSPTAKREKWLRRVTLDLTGLPPTIEELDAFLNDESTNADDRVVERLLASPRYGETMAMDWLDAARYADTNGYQGDRERTMWPWRDWVIDAFNRNQPFDEFTVWQLAGDQLPQSDPNIADEQKLATGFCRNHMINGEGGRIAEENRVEYVFDQIETLGTVWMGLTVQCCRCHDHKFDPIAQSEYYKLFAFFNQTPVNGGGGDPQMAPNMLAANERQSRELKQLESVFNSSQRELKKVEEQLDTCDAAKEVGDALAKKPRDRNGDQWKQLETHFADQKEFTKLAKDFRQAKEKRDRKRGSIPKVMIMQDMAKEKYRETFILNKGLYNQKQDKKVTAAGPAFLPRVATDHETPNRLDLANWLTSEEHPLTARVTVNRIWARFFRTGLVKTADDFGVQGEKPSHPKLLDWLAVEFVESGWNLKHLVRLIVSSSTYRQSANVDLATLELDPENRLLARGPRRRMPAWMIRDHALATSGLLAGKLGGVSVKTYQPKGIWAEASFGKKKYQQDQGEALYRRSLYIYWRRIVGPTVFFDMSKRQTCSVKSSQTNTPLHALVTLNDVTYVEAARMMATQLLQANVSDEERITTAFRIATSRTPSTKEQTLLIKRLVNLRQHFSKNSDAAEKLLQVGEMRSADLPESDLAAYTTVCLLIMNLDEALNK